MQLRRDKALTVPWAAITRSRRHRIIVRFQCFGWCGSRGALLCPRICPAAAGANLWSCQSVPQAASPSRTKGNRAGSRAAQNPTHEPRRGTLCPCAVKTNQIKSTSAPKYPKQMDQRLGTRPPGPHRQVLSADQATRLPSASRKSQPSRRLSIAFGV